MLGSLIALGVLTNVLAINFGFDITVKVLSTFLVLASLFVLEKYFRRLKATFIQNITSEPLVITQFIEKPFIKRALKGIILSLIIIECSWTYVSSETWNGDNANKIAYFGSYDVEVKSGNSVIPEFENVKRIHFHNSGYLIFETEDGEFNDYPIYFKSNDLNTIHFRNSAMKLKIKRGVDTFTFSCKMPGNSFQLITTKIDLEKLPYHFDSFHWTVDSFMEE